VLVETAVVANTHQLLVVVVEAVEHKHKDLSITLALLAHQGRVALVELQAR
jgi:hypothetical protein